MRVRAEDSVLLTDKEPRSRASEDDDKRRAMLGDAALAQQCVLSAFRTGARGWRRPATQATTGLIVGPPS